jgi:hypothetical protein
MKPSCDQNGSIHFLPDGEHEVSLHDFEEVEVMEAEGITIQLLRCRRCGEYSLGWWKGGIDDRPDQKTD